MTRLEGTVIHTIESLKETISNLKQLNKKLLAEKLLYQGREKEFVITINKLKEVNSIMQTRLGENEQREMRLKNQVAVLHAQITQIEKN